MTGEYRESFCEKMKKTALIGRHRVIRFFKETKERVAFRQKRGGFWKVIREEADLRAVACAGITALFISWIVVFAGGCGESERAYITPVSREEGSGTRGAFTEIFGIEKIGDDGEKYDATSDLSEVTNSTSVMITTVMLNKNAIGYISLGTMSEEIKAVAIDGVIPTAETVKNGSYPVVRSFAVVTKQKISAEASDFIRFMTSEEGRQIIEENGYIAPAVQDSSSKSYRRDSFLSGAVSVAGSSSVVPVMEALKESYAFRQPQVKVEIQQSDSTQGIAAVGEGICEIGMISRPLKESEASAGMTALEIAKDGIAVIVNCENPVSGLTSKEVKKIYMGELTEWGEIDWNE